MEAAARPEIVDASQRRFGSQGMPHGGARLMSTGDELRALQDVRSILSEFGEEPIRIFGQEIPSCLAQLAQKSDSPEEIRVEALAALADLAGSNRGALLVAEVGALPLCVRMLQSSDEATREAAMRVLNQVQQNSDVF
ncbi:unnamed protein product [Durusdinium trenchii]|uniref:Uncharacterized protein n=1 Tax=Durusdinium trenchii TaxID=1381693 RepID=A0ABP0QM01_9DINO